MIQIGTPEDTSVPYNDWTAPYRTPPGLAMVMEKYGERFDLLLGRRTYDAWAGFWPKAPASPMGDRLNTAMKFVVTHRPEGLHWGPVQALGSDFLSDVRSLKAGEGVDLILAGSTTLASSLIEAGLADELILLVSPVLLGQGKRIFADGASPKAFKFESTATSPTGVLVNAYSFVGALPNLK